MSDAPESEDIGHLIAELKLSHQTGAHNRDIFFRCVEAIEHLLNTRAPVGGGELPDRTESKTWEQQCQAHDTLFPLFKFLAQEFGVTATDGNMQDLIEVVRPLTTAPEPVVKSEEELAAEYAFPELRDTEPGRVRISRECAGLALLALEFKADRMADGFGPGMYKKQIAELEQALQEQSE